MIIPSLVILPFLGMKRAFVKKGVVLILVYLLLIIKVLFGSWDNGFWLLQSVKLIDGLLFISLLTLKPTKQKNLLLVFFLSFSVLISSNNPNFGGWLLFLIAVISYQSSKGLVYILKMLLLIFFSISIEAYTYALGILAFLFFPSERNLWTASLYSALGTLFMIVLYDYLIEKDLASSIALIVPTISIRPAMWLAFFNNTSLSEILFGSITGLNSFVNTAVYSSSYFPFTYIGKSFHNIWVDILWKYGLILVLLLVAILKRSPKRVYYLPLLLIWSFEPSLGVFQLVTVYFLDKRFYVDNMYSRS
jgi:hypothetical protein